MILKIRSTLEASLEKWTLSSLIHLKRTGLNLWILIRKTTNSELLLGFLSPLLEVKGRKPSLFFTLSSRRASPTTMSFFIHPAEMLCLWHAGCGSSTVPGTGHSPGKWASGLQLGMAASCVPEDQTDHSHSAFRSSEKYSLNLFLVLL